MPELEYFTQTVKGLFRVSKKSKLYNDIKQFLADLL